MNCTRNVIGFPRSRVLPEPAATSAGDAAADAAPGPERPDGPIDDMSACLLAVAEHRDRAAFAVLFRHFGPRIRTWLLRGGGDAGSVDDVLQDVFAAIWRKAHLYDSQRASAAAWIFTIARNRRIDAFRRDRRSEFDPQDPAFRPDPAPESEQALVVRQRANAVRAALAALSEEQREVLRLSFYEGESYAAIAIRLGIPLGTAKSRARLAFRRLRTELGAQREDLR